MVDKATCELLGTDDQVRKIVAAGFDLKSAGVSLDYLKTAGSPAADLKAAGFSGVDLKEVGIFTTNAHLRDAISKADTPSVPPSMPRGRPCAGPISCNWDAA